MLMTHDLRRLGVLLGVLWLLGLAAAADVTARVLPNGLTVLVKEVHAAPVVTVDVWYKAGSRNERPGITGISHLLEHMTYKGAKGYDRDAMRALVKRNGALDNGATFYDYTHYHTTIASDRLEPVLRLEAARMSSATLAQADLDSEWTVVRSELEGRENSPGSQLFLELMAAAFKSHPYQWPVIGWRADVEHTKAADLRAYYRTYYIPNNATLVIVGDVDTTQALTLARRHFDGIKRGPEPPQWVTPEPPQRGERRVMVRRQGQVPFMHIAWKVPAITHDDTPALYLLEQILGAGRTSRLYKNIIETRLGVSAWSDSLILRDSGLFIVGAAVSPGEDIKKAEGALLAEIERIKTEAPTADELARARRQLEAAFIFGRDSVTEQAEQLGHYATVAGDWAFLDKLPARLQAVTPADIVRVAKTYLLEDTRTIGVFQPTTPAKQDAALPLTTPAGYHDGDAARPAQAASTTRLDRTPPAPGQSRVARERFALPNGLVLIVQENHANPTVAIHASLRAGKAYDPPGRAGLADLAANLLEYGTSKRSAQQIAEELEGSAAELSAGTGWETTVVRGKALSGDTELLLRNLADLLRNPAYPADELEKMRERTLAGLAMERDEPAKAAYRGFYRAVLPAGHPYRLSSFDEEAAGIKAITRDNLLAFHKARYTPGTTILAVVGDVRVGQVREMVERYLGDWHGATPALATFPTPTAPEKTRVVTRIPDKAQANLYVGHAGELKRADQDYYAAQLMNLILGGGGALNSRLGDVIRDQHGLAYSVYSTFHASTGTGPWYAVLGVNPANIDKALALLQGEIMRMREQGVTKQEVADAAAYLTGAHAIMLETNAAIAGSLQDAEYFGLGIDYLDRESALYRAVTPEQVTAAAKKYLHPDQLVISVAGAVAE